MGYPIADMIGQRHGIVTVIAFEGSNTKHAAMWRVACDCGAQDVLTRKYLLADGLKTRVCVHYHDGKRTTAKQARGMISAERGRIGRRVKAREIDRRVKARAK